MSSAGWLKIAAEGVQDVYINGTPDISYFTTLYKSHSSFLLNTFEIPFNTPPLASGGNAICRIPYKGDFLRGLSLKVNLPSVYTPGPGWIKTLRYSPSLQFNFTDGSNVIINAQQTPSNIFATYNEISNVYMALSNIQGSFSNGMYVYGTPYRGLVRTSNVTDTQYIVSNLITQQYVEPVTSVTHINFANCIANATTTNITNALLSPVTSLYVTPVVGMNVFSTGYTGAVNVVTVNSYGGNLFDTYVNLTSQQPKSFNSTVYYSNITTSYSTNPVTDLYFTGTSTDTLTDNMLVGFLFQQSVKLAFFNTNFYSVPFIGEVIRFVGGPYYGFIGTATVTSNVNYPSEVTVTLSEPFQPLQTFSNLSVFYGGGAGPVKTATVSTFSNSTPAGTVTANIYNSTNGRLNFSSWPPFSIVGNVVEFRTQTFLSTQNITQTQFTITSTPTLISNSIFSGMNIFFANTTFNVTSTPNVASVSGSVITANIISQQPRTESGTMFISNIVAITNVANVTTTLLEFADGPYGGLTYGNIYGLPFTANVATVFPAAISVNVSSRQPFSFTNPVNVFFSTTTSNLSTIAITTSNIGFFTPTGVPFVGDVITFASGGFTGTTTVTSNTNYPSDVTVSIASQQPTSFSNLSVTYPGGKSATVSTLSISRLEMFVSNLVGPDPSSILYANIQGTTNLGGHILPYWGPVQNVISYNAPIATLSFPPQQPVSFQNNYTVYAFTSARLVTANIVTAVYTYTPVSGNVLASVGQYISTNNITTSNISFFNATTPPQVGDVLTFTSSGFTGTTIVTSNINYPTDFTVSVTSQEPKSLTNASVIYRGSNTANISTISFQLGNFTSSPDYITAANATSLVVSFPPRQPFVKNNYFSYITPYSNMTYVSTPITKATFNISNTFGVINKSTTIPGNIIGLVTPSNLTSTTVDLSFGLQQPFSFTSALATFQISTSTVTTNTIPSSLVTVNSGTLLTGATPNYSMLRTSNSSLIGTLSNVVTINAAARSATLTFPSVQQPLSTSESVYVGYSAQATTNLVTSSNVTLSGVLGTGATIQLGANVLGMGYTGIATVAQIISANTSLRLTLSTPQQPASYSNLMFFSPSQADFTSPSSIPWLTFPKLTAQNVAVFYNQTTQKWNFKSYSKPIANLAFTSYENMVFWGFDPHNRA